jgi:DNA-directed RNA polymerase specialized sigma24 family protein
VHPLAVEKDAEFRAASQAARADPAELAKRQEALLAACRGHAEPQDPRPAPPPRASSYPRGAELAAIRETHAKAYASWTKAEEEDLKRRHYAGETVEAIAARLGRKPGAIRSRLKKLALI